MPPSCPLSTLILTKKKRKWKSNSDEVWMNFAVLLSCIISPPTESVAGRFRLDRVSFSAYWHSQIISKIKPLPSLSCWPDDLSCHVFIHAKWLFLWYVSFGVTDKSPALGEKGKCIPLGSLYYQAEQVLWLLWKPSWAHWCHSDQFGTVVQYEWSRKRLT